MVNNDVKKNIIATIGMFDGVHLGHQALLDSLHEEAKKCGMSTAVVTFKEHPQRVLRPESGLKMVMTLADRIAYIKAGGVG